MEHIAQDGLAEGLLQAWIKLLMRKFVLLIMVIIVVGMLMLRLGIAGISCFTIYPPPQLAV